MTMQLQEILFTQGFGTRRVCAGLVQQGHVQVFASAPDAAPPDAGMFLQAPPSAPQPCTDAVAEFNPEGLWLRVQGRDWPYQAKATLVLHKPAGTECSQKPSTYPSVYTLLPGPLRQRPNKGAVDGVQAVGRLDQDTTGLLLLTDDGQLLHRLTSPKHHAPKVYEVGLKHPVTPVQVQRLLQGVVLDDDPKPVASAACEATGECSLRLTLTQGKYHQVKRMLAAVGNRVETLHRSRIGGLELPDDLLPGEWRWVGEAGLGMLFKA